MIENCTITAVASPLVTSTGQKRFSAESSIAVRAFVDGPSRAQQLTVAADLANVTAVLYVTAGNMATPAINDRVSLRIDTETSTRVYEVAKVSQYRKDGVVSHDEIYLRKAAV